MASLRRFPSEMLPAKGPVNRASVRRKALDLPPFVLAALRRTLSAVGHAAAKVCPEADYPLEASLTSASVSLSAACSQEEFAAAETRIYAELEMWASTTARYYAQRADEVKQILLTVAGASRAIAERDRHYGQRLHSVTSDLQRIATFEDISQMRGAIEQTALEFKHSIERMATERKDVFDKLQRCVESFQCRMQEAESAASLDGLTGLHNRVWMEAQIEDRIRRGTAFCIGLFDLEGFKGVNELHGRSVGDDALQQFATELRDLCGAAGVVARWGGDRFLVLLDQPLAQAKEQVQRMRHSIRGRYTVQGKSSALVVGVHASVGLVRFEPPENMRQLLERAGAAVHGKEREGFA